MRYLGIPRKEGLHLLEVHFPEREWYMKKMASLEKLVAQLQQAANSSGSADDGGLNSVAEAFEVYRCCRKSRSCQGGKYISSVLSICATRGVVK